MSQVERVPVRRYQQIPAGEIKTEPGTVPLFRVW